MKATYESLWLSPLGIVILFATWTHCPFTFQLLSLFDIMVILGCTFLYALPGIPWDAFTLEIYPRCLPFILPLTQICLMSSVYCTILMSFERYVRICHLCQLRYNSWLSEGTFGTLIAFVTLFPVCFYMPRFFEMRSKEEERVIYELYQL